MTLTMSTGLITLCLFRAVPSQAQVSEQKAIEFVKRISTSILDPTLPSFQFSEWLAMARGDSAVVQWELNDCGEQTGDPVVDSLRDIPACIGVSVTLPDHRKIGITIAVGTARRGLVGDPEIVEMYLESHGQYFRLKRLSDLRSPVKQSLR